MAWSQRDKMQRCRKHTYELKPCQVQVTVSWRKNSKGQCINFHEISKLGWNSRLFMLLCDTAKLLVWLSHCFLTYSLQILLPVIFFGAVSPSLNVQANKVTSVSLLLLPDLFPNLGHFWGNPHEKGSCGSHEMWHFSTSQSYRQAILFMWRPFTTKFVTKVTYRVLLDHTL